MIQISQIKLSIDHTEKELENAIVKSLKGKPFLSYQIIKKSLDARKKEDLKYIYAVQVEVKEEAKLIKQLKNKNITLVKEIHYEFPNKGEALMKHRPIVVGAGPAGLFCAYMLAKEGYRPLVLERGQKVEERVKTIESYWNTKKLDTECNVQFGEGGAGTFSDGKLNTGVKDKWGRNKEVLQTFVKYGAPEEILYWNKPHIGTDRLRDVVKNMRNDIIALGGEFRFSSKVTDICFEEGEKEDTKQKMPFEQFMELQKEMEEGEAKQVLLEQKQQKVKAVCVNGTEWIPCDVLVLAIGHSARDTFSMLYEKQMFMTKKSFAIGLRAEHPRDMINRSQYGEDYNETYLPTADYKLVHHAKNGRSVYSFCMCPGGLVVNSSSEEGRIVVNGMSNYKRDAKNSNTAIVVNVTPDDFFTEDSPLAGVEFQRKWEALAYEIGGNDGSVPIQLFGDFENDQVTTKLGEVEPSLQGQYAFANLRKCLPDYVSEAIVEGIQEFEHKIKGYSRKDTILTGVETRTSSPIRMERDKEFVSNINGLYPCGEGAGYAGGITSAAIDGIKVAEAIAKQYQPL